VCLCPRMFLRLIFDLLLEPFLQLIKRERLVDSLLADLSLEISDPLLKLRDRSLLDQVSQLLD
jgi:hypothetical protein